ncbi:MAG: hypothetical protein ACQCN6_03230 [Candidatus Bathyarchaeia archaeon]|jgi:hypothetical protein
MEKRALNGSSLGFLWLKKGKAFERVSHIILSKVTPMPSSKKKHNVNTRLAQEKKAKREKEAQKKALLSQLPAKGKKK